LSEWIENLLRRTDGLHQDSPVTINIACPPKGIAWEGKLRDLRDALEKSLAAYSLQRQIKEMRPIVTGETLTIESPKWEYTDTLFNVDMNYIADFNKMGGKGWELVSFDPGRGLAVFKRPRLSSGEDGRDFD
jgi:hypothetical protein